ncbi:MAG: L,D-transpeptidase family protein [Proteobacteria bacterium]|nr:L,D-transpeptidase family protein [Pseudomonadota bacterium]
MNRIPLKSFVIMYLFPLLILPFTTLLASDEAVQEIIRSRAEHVQQFKEMYLQDASISGIVVLPKLYEQRDFRPAWTNPRNVEGLLRIIGEMDREGLYPADYHQEKLGDLKQQLEQTDNPAPELLADFDIALSDALTRIVYHILFGKVDPERLDANWNIYREIEDIEPATWLQNLINSQDIYQALREIMPDERFFVVLRKGLEEYRTIAENGGWPTIPEGPVLKKDMSDERIPLIRQRLQITGDLKDSQNLQDQFFDDALFEAVQHFQNRHGLNPDGVIGKNTLETMNVSVQKRIEQILVNLERGRWVYRDIDDEFILVNIAGFKANYIGDNKLVWKARAQVGKDYRRTPIFKAELKYLVFNPTWTVPPTILKKDVLPAIKRDSTYLEKKNMKVIDRSGKPVNPASLDWSKYTGKNFPYSIRQEPGPSNALGRVKFIFPNKHFVFLHDTPSKELFERETRTFSSGCIRVENPFHLAEALLKNPEKWNLNKIEQLIETGKTKTVYLNKPIPVLLLYATAFHTLDDDNVHFRNDVYDRDQAILKELQEHFKRKERHLGKN